MPEEKSKILITLFAGLITGFMICLAICLSWNIPGIIDRYVSIKLGKFLEIDKLYLRNGDTLTGHVLEETPEEVWFSFPSGSVKFNRKDILRIDKKIYARYIQGAW